MRNSLCILEALYVCKVFAESFLFEVGMITLSYEWNFAVKFGAAQYFTDVYYNSMILIR